MQSVFNGSILGPAGAPLFQNIRIIAGLNNYAMAGLDVGFCARFPALNTLDITAIKIYWNAVTTPGTVEARIETIDVTTGKPTGTLYDAAATKSFTPAVGLQTVTFDTPPSTGLSEGTYYGVVLLTTVAGTTQTLRSYTTKGGNGPAALTAAVGTTRTNFTVVNQSTPAVCLVMEDATEEMFGMCPYNGTIVSVDVYGVDRACAAKFTLLASQVIDGIFYYVGRSGTPGDLRLRILDSSNVAVTGTTLTVDEDYATLNAAVGWFYNYWRLAGCAVLSATAINSGFIVSTSTNMSTTFTWTDDTDTISPLALLHGVDVAASAAIHPINGLVVAR